LEDERAMRLAVEDELQSVYEVLAAAVPGGELMSLREVANVAADMLKRYQWPAGGAC